MHLLRMRMRYRSKVPQVPHSLRRKDLRCGTFVFRGSARSRVARKTRQQEMTVHFQLPQPRIVRGLFCVHRKWHSGDGASAKPTPIFPNPPGDVMSRDEA